MKSFFVEGRHRPDDVVQLGGSDAHKVLNVLRMRSGDHIEIVDSAAQRFSAALAIDGRSVRATLLRVEDLQPQAGVCITVAQGVPKGQKMDFVVEKLTELGVSAILPLESERTIASGAGANKIERWRRLAKTAAQQSGRTAIPEISDPQSFETLLRQFNDYDCVLFPWELAQREPLRERLPALLSDARTVLVVIGPEGGFSHAEAQAASDAGAHLISLGSRILRTETAGLAVLAVIGYVTGP